MGVKDLMIKGMRGKIHSGVERLRVLNNCGGYKASIYVYTAALFQCTSFRRQIFEPASMSTQSGRNTRPDGYFRYIHVVTAPR
jgi:hypothetical protein